MQRNNAALRETRASRTIKPPRHGGATLPHASLEKLAASMLVSPDDVSLEIEDLAPHFLFEATQSSMPSAPPSPVQVIALGADAALREDFFDESGERDESEREKLREFERIWNHIISRELVSTEL